MLPGMDGSCVVQILHNVHIIAAGRLGSTAADDLCAHHTILYHTKRHHSKNRLEVAAAASRLFFFFFFFAEAVAPSRILCELRLQSHQFAVASYQFAVASVCSCSPQPLAPLCERGVYEHTLFFFYPFVLCDAVYVIIEDLFCVYTMRTLSIHSLEKPTSNYSPHAPRPKSINLCMGF